jgi:hypothetical protein
MMETNPFQKRPPFCKSSIDNLTECHRFKQIAKNNNVDLTPMLAGPNTIVETIIPCVFCCLDYFDKKTDPVRS